MIADMELKKLKTIARDIRIDIIKMIEKAGSGHPGGALSATDILTVLYFHKMHRQNPIAPPH